MQEQRKPQQDYMDTHNTNIDNPKGDINAVQGIPNISPDEAKDVTNVYGEATGHVPSNEFDTPERLSRRAFMNKMSWALTGLGGVLVTVPVLGYIVAPLFKVAPDLWRAVGPLNDFKVGTTVEVKFENSDSLVWSGVTAQTAAWLRREADNAQGNPAFTAFAVNCTHLGCPVSWLPGAQLFLCPCHGGSYYADGTVAGGPPPRRLVTYDTRVRNGQVEVLASRTPIPGTIGE